MWYRVELLSNSLTPSPAGSNPYCSHDKGRRRFGPTKMRFGQSHSTLHSAMEYRPRCQQGLLQLLFAREVPRLLLSCKGQQRKAECNLMELISTKRLRQIRKLKIPLSGSLSSIFAPLSRRSLITRISPSLAQLHREASSIPFKCSKVSTLTRTLCLTFIHSHSRQVLQ